VSLAQPRRDAIVANVRVEGAQHVPEHLMRQCITTRAGDPLDEARLADDVRCLLALEALDDVRVELELVDGRARLSFVVRERKTIGLVELVGAPRAQQGDYLPPASGELHDPARIARSARALELRLRDQGHLDARVTSRERPRGRFVDVCLRAEPGPRFVLDSVHFVGARAIEERELLRLVRDHGERANRPGTPLRTDLLEYDLLFVSALYYDRGFVNVQLGAPRVIRNRSTRALRVEIDVVEGERHTVSEVRFQGKHTPSPKKLIELLGVTRGDVFNRSRVVAGIERVKEHFRARGRTVDVIPTTTIDPDRPTLKLTLEIRELP